MNKILTMAGILLALSITLLIWNEKSITIPYQLTQQPTSKPVYEICYVSGICLTETKENYYLAFEKENLKNKSYQIQSLYHQNELLIINIIKIGEKEKEPKTIKMSKEKNGYPLEIENIIIHEI